MRESSTSNGGQESRPIRVHIIRQVWTVLWVGALAATLFTAWTPLGLFPVEWAERISQAIGPQSTIPELVIPTATPRPRPRVGIVAGHWGNDSGAECPDGLQEVDLNLEIATLVQNNLLAEDFDVDLMQEFDEQLTGYQGLALVSIHADSCDFVNNEATGYKVAAAQASARPDKADRLVACLRSRYQTATNLTFHAGSITVDMTEYHAFREIHNETTAAIIETGFMNLDRQTLTQNQDVIAKGISDGVLCFLYNEDASFPTAP